MSGDAGVVAAELRRIASVLSDIDRRLESARAQELERFGRTELTAVFVAQLLDNYYTALETLFLRVSQFFENTLASSRWHADLLDKMSLQVPGVRPRLLAEDTAKLLRELMRFRHFKRYYLELDYDWAKLDYLMSVYDRARPLVRRDLDRFLDFLDSLGKR